MKLCRDCLWSADVAARDPTEYRHECSHPRVVDDHPKVLADWRESGDPRVRCADERNRRGVLAPCGSEGRLWEPKP